MEKGAIDKMTTYTEQLVLTSNGQRVTYHNITEQVKEMVAKSGIKMAFVLFSRHILLVQLFLRNSCTIWILMGMNFYRLI